MHMEIDQEPNDLAVAKLFGVASLVVYYDNLAGAWAAGDSVYPSVATVLCDPKKVLQAADAPSQEKIREFVRGWAADKLGIDIADVSVEEN